MQEDEHSQKEEEEEQTRPVFEEEEIRISSSGSSPNFDDFKPPKPSANTNQFEMFDQLISAKQELIISRLEPEKDAPKQPSEPEEGEAGPGVGGQSVIEQVEKEWIIKNAEMQRIGGTFDFFSAHLQRYRKHLLARKTVLGNISALIDKNKVSRAHPVMLLKEYFKDYASDCSDFHERSYKYELPQREESDNKMANMRVELKLGFDKLLALRRQTGNQLSRLEKFMKTTTVSKIDKAVEVYWGVMAVHQNKCHAKREIFEEKQKKFQKRIDKVSKVYGKGRVGSQIDEDVFEEMAKFVKEERELRYSIFDWGKQILNLRRNAMNADYGFFTELQAILTEYKQFNDTVYQLQKKKYNFTQRLKGNIETNFLFQKLCTPLDSDYIISVVNYKNKASVALLKQQDYQDYLNEEYFNEIIGDTHEFLKGTILKSFPLKNIDEQLVKTISGNLIHYNKRTLQMKYKAKIGNTTPTFEGHGCVYLKQIVKGIIFDSENTQRVYFKDDNRAQELVMILSGELQAQ